MNRQEFFRRLEYLLRGIPESDKMDALAYYNDYFDDAGRENEQQVIQELTHLAIYAEPSWNHSYIARGTDDFGRLL